MTDHDMAVEFGDTIRIKDLPHTSDARISGLEGVVHGFTTPSASGITATGPLINDFTLNVYVDSLGRDYWLDPSDIEFLRRPDVMEFGVAGNTIRITRTDGGYVEEVIRKRPWWRFW